MIDKELMWRCNNADITEFQSPSGRLSAQDNKDPSTCLNILSPELQCIYCLTQLSGIYIYIYIYNIYYISNNYMFRHFSLGIFRLISEKFSKQLYLTCVYCIQWGFSCLIGFSFINLKMANKKCRNM